MPLPLSGTAEFAVKYLAATETGTIEPGAVLGMELLIPEGCELISGGAHCQDVSIGSATNYTLKSSYPLFRDDGRKGWFAVFTNTYPDMHPQVIQFSIYATYVGDAQPSNANS